jgi:hypothetical protein
MSTTYTNPGPAVTTGDTNILGGGPAQIGVNDEALVGFYGNTPVVQRASSVQATSLISGISTGAVSTNAALKLAVLEIMDTLDGLGLWKGGA